MEHFQIGNRIIGKGYPTYIIAELSANHAGNLDNAKELIRVAKHAGADCVKLQTYTADTLTIDCDNKYFQISSGTWKGENLYSLYKKAYTPWEWHPELMEEARKVGLDFFSTPFDKTAVDFLEELGVGFYKIASFELVDIPLIKYVASKGKPIILSTGMASKKEISEACEAIRSEGNESFALLKCSSAYPSIPADMNLATMQDLRDSFLVPIGLSDHSMGSLGAVVAVSMGAAIIEKHLCLSRDIPNPDASFSMEPQEFSSMVQQIREAEKAIGKISYSLSKKEQENALFRKSLFVVKDMEEGELFTLENVRSIRPSYGMKPKHLFEVLGQVASCHLVRGTPLEHNHIKWDK